MSAFGGEGREGGGLFAVGFGGVVLCDGLGEGFDGVAFDKGDDAAAEAAAGHAGADDAGDGLGDFDEGVEFGGGDLVIVAEGGVGGDHEGAAGGVVALGECVGEGGGAGDFGDDVAGAV